MKNRTVSRGSGLAVAAFLPMVMMLPCSSGSKRRIRAEQDFDPADGPVLSCLLGLEKAPLSLERDS